MTKHRFLPLLLGLALAVSAGQALAAGDAGKGEKVFKKCKACHSLDAGKNKVGPSLAGIVGRKAGSAAKDKYSKSLKAAAAKGLTWDEASLDKYLANPKTYLREYLGNKKARSKMAFKLKKDGDRGNVIAFLAGK